MLSGQDALDDGRGMALGCGTVGITHSTAA
jgi:hypothetical protein